MCNLYSITTSQEALRALCRCGQYGTRADNLPPKYAVFPDFEAPVIRKAVDGERMLDVMRWGIAEWDFHLIRPRSGGSTTVSAVSRSAALSAALGLPKSWPSSDAIAGSEA
jgi:putative SOS response-associated peptidase YedK